MCGRTGRLLTEEEAVERRAAEERSSLDGGMRTGGRKDSGSMLQKTEAHRMLKGSKDSSQMLSVISPMASSKMQRKGHPGSHDSGNRSHSSAKELAGRSA